MISFNFWKTKAKNNKLSNESDLRFMNDYLEHILLEAHDPDVVKKLLNAANAIYVDKNNKHKLEQDKKNYIAEIILKDGNVKDSEDPSLDSLTLGKIVGFVQNVLPAMVGNTQWQEIKKSLNVPVLNPPWVATVGPRRTIGKPKAVFAPVAPPPPPKPPAPTLPEVKELTITGESNPTPFRTILTLLIPSKDVVILRNIANDNPRLVSQTADSPRIWSLTLDKNDILSALSFNKMLQTLRSAGVPHKTLHEAVNNRKLVGTYIPDASSKTTGKLPLWVENRAGDSALLSFPFLLNNERCQKAKNEMYYIFYSQTPPRSLHRGSLLVSGGKLQYYNAITELKKLDFDTSELETVYNEKKDSVFADSMDNPEVYGNIVKHKAEAGGQRANEIKKFRSMVFKKIPYLRQLHNSKGDDKIKLYLKQYEGIAHLYSRSSAINGDETGVGKTYQFLVAAKLRMIDSGKKCLIVTIASVRDQTANDIVTLFGPAEASKIGYDITKTDGKSWIIVSYERFQQPEFNTNKTIDINKVNSFVDKYITNQYGVVVLDEIHRAKSVESMRSNVLKYVVNAIPVKYGLTATLSANKPDDVQNQLKMIGHPIGALEKFSEHLIQNPALVVKTSQFNNAYQKEMNRKDFEVNIVDKNYKPITREPVLFVDALDIGKKAQEKNPNIDLFMVDDTTDPMTLMLGDRAEFLYTDKFMKAQKMNRLLHTTGVYDRKTKKQIMGNKLPNIKRRVVERPINLELFCNNVRKEFEKIKSKPTKDGQKAKIEIMTIRRLIAVAKVNITARRVEEILKNHASEIKKEIAAGPQPYKKDTEGHKIVVFTNFIESAKRLVKAINQKLQEFATKEQLTQPLKVVEYFGNSSESELKKNIDAFKTDPNVRVIVMTMQKGGTGIDFPNIARNMVLNDVFYTPESAEQSEGRIYRINTKKSPEIYYPIAKNLDIDKRIYETLKERRQLAKQIQKSQHDYIQNNNEQNLADLVAKEKKSHELERNLEFTLEQEIMAICNKNKNESILNPLYMNFIRFMMLRG